MLFADNLQNINIICSSALLMNSVNNLIMLIQAHANPSIMLYFPIPQCRYCQNRRYRNIECVCGLHVNVHGRWSVRAFAIQARRLSLNKHSRSGDCYRACALADDRNRVCRIIWNACNKAAIAHASTYDGERRAPHTARTSISRIKAHTHTHTPELRRGRLCNNVFE